MPDAKNTIPGHYGPQGEPLLNATLYLPCSVDPIDVTLLISTGTNQTIIAAQDWQRSDLDITEWRWRQKAMQRAGEPPSEDTRVTLVMGDTKGRRHHRGISAILAQPDHINHSVAGLDLLAGSVLHMNPRDHILTVQLPDEALHYNPPQPVKRATS